MKRRLALLVAVLICGLPTSAGASAQCAYWASRVDESIAEPPGFEHFDEQDPQNVLAGIACLLQMAGRTGTARFGGATRFDVSQIDPRPSAEVAALFYISYLFYNDWGAFAQTVTLVDARGRVNTPEAVAKAYGYYRSWYGKVCRIGIDRARRERLDPLAGKDVHWR